MDIRTVLQLFNESGGVGLRLAGKPYVKDDRESVPQFAKRVLEDYNAREASEEIEIPVEDADDGVHEGSPAEDGRGRGEPSGRSEEDVPGVEASLEELVEAKVAALRRSGERVERDVEEAARVFRTATTEREAIYAELEVAIKFLEEITDGMSPEIREEIGDNIPGEEEEGSSGSDPVGEPSGSTGDKGEST